MVVTRRCVDARDGGSAPPRGLVPRTISLDEWLAHVAANPALTLVRLAANEEEALRAAHPVRLTDRASDRWLYWGEGEISASGPDPALLAAMHRVAGALGARVRHENDEYFRVPYDDMPFAARCALLVEGIDEARTPEEERALAEHRATRAVVVAGTIACVASVMWLVQA